METTANIIRTSEAHEISTQDASNKMTFSRTALSYRSVLLILCSCLFVSSAYAGQRATHSRGRATNGPRVLVGAALDSMLNAEAQLRRQTLDLMVPKMIYPLNGVPTTIVPEFTLGTVSGVDRYDLQVASDSLFTVTVSYSYWIFPDTTRADSTIRWFAAISSPDIFHNNTKYFWRIKAMVNSASISSPWSQTQSYITTTVGSPLPAPSLLSPPNSSSQPWINLELNWGNIPTARYYQIQWTTSSSFNGFNYQWSPGNSPTFTINVKPSSFYYWRVLAYSDSSVSQFSAVRSFQTTDHIVLNDANGSFDDGSGVDNYDNSRDIYWLIEPGGAQQIVLSFISMYTESGYDIVRVYDGDTTAAPLLGTFSGNTLPADLSATSGTMLVRFTTDWLTTYSGWQVVYTTVKSDPKLPIIIVPGIMGSPLFNHINGGDALTEPERSWVVVSRLGELDLAEDGVNAAPGLQVNIIPRPIADYRYELGELPFDYTNVSLFDRLPKMRKRTLSFYEGLVTALTSELGYTLHNDDSKHPVGENLFIFTYDWRKHIADQGSELSAYIDQVKSWTGATQVKIIAHSMGGLLTKSAIRTGRTDVNTLIFLGTPHLGAPKSIYVSLTGEATEELGGFFEKLTVTGTVKEIARNFPSEYELYPSRKYTDTYSNGSIAYIDDGNLCVPVNYDDTFSNLRGRMVGSSQQTELNTGLLDAAKSLHDITDAPIDFGTTQIYNIFGEGKETGGIVRFFDNQSTLLCTKFGDGTVPEESATNVGSPTTWNSLSVPGVAHADLCNNPYSVGDVIDVLRGTLPKPLSGEKSLAVGKYPTRYQVSARGYISLHAYDWFGRHTGSTSDSTEEANIPGSVYISGGPAKSYRSQVILLPRISGFRIEMVSSDTVNTATLDIDDIKEGDDAAFVSYRGLPLEAASKARVSIDSVRAGLTLSLDVHGDSSALTPVLPSRHVVNSINGGSGLLEGIPRAYLLDQNYPNPFNPSTTLRYGLPSKSHVTIAVYNILGQKVTQLVNGEEEAGYHSVRFDGSNLASGVYFYRLQAGSFVQTRKLLLLR